MNLEKLRVIAEQAKADEMKEAQEKPSMVYISRSEVIKPYFDGYEQALKDVEDNDPTFGVDLMEEIQEAMWKIDEHIEMAQQILCGIDGAPTSDEINAMGQIYAWDTARSLLKDITDKVAQQASERNAHES